MIHGPVRQGNARDKVTSSNCIVDIEKLDDAITKNACCKHCIDISIKTYLQDFFDYADNQIKDTKKRKAVRNFTEAS